MSITEPSKTSIRVHEFFWLKLMKGYYRRFVESFGLRGDEMVLDFGCGPGSTSKFIAQILERGGGELTCLDLSKAWIERVKKHVSRFSNVECYAEDIRKWDEKNNYFDAVAIHFMLHDIDKSERYEVVKALAEKMKTGAKLFIREPTKEGHGMRPEEIRELMSKSGLKETDSKATKSLMMGVMYTGFFSKAD
ncbi:MAG: methyltransferase domain-containing protein [Candidatus Aminicenantes bacterium]|nr:methyltransferase domain-containing protein [Candidatus Aminicenantes bacterium]